MSDFSSYIDELIGDPSFRARHPHFHVRLFPISELEFVSVGELTDKDLRQYNKTLTALLSGAPVDRITVELSNESATPTLAAGEPILQAARDAGVSELFARVRYESREVVPVWRRSSNVPTLEALTTDDDVPLVTDDDIELME